MAEKYDFVKEPEDHLMCLICREVARNPKQETHCGKLFCSRCLEKLEEDHKCPHCRQDPCYFKDKRGDIEIKSLLVKCGNTESGCSWTGPLKDASRHVVKSCDYEMVNCKHEDIGCSEKTTRKRMRQHEEDDTAHVPLFIDAVEKMRQEKKIASGSGKTIIVNNFKRLKQENEVIQSEPFYSHPNGYKMCLVVAPNGIHEARNSHVSVSVGLLKGPHDSDLPWPFEGKITVTLLNQVQNDYHHEAIIITDEDDGITQPSVKSKVRIVFSSIEFISHSSLYASSVGSYLLNNTVNKYLSNDTLHFRVSIETDLYKPWLDNNSSFLCTSLNK